MLYFVAELNEKLAPLVVKKKHICYIGWRSNIVNKNEVSPNNPAKWTREKQVFYSLLGVTRTTLLTPIPIMVILGEQDLIIDEQHKHV